VHAENYVCVPLLHVRSDAYDVTAVERDDGDQTPTFCSRSTTGDDLSAPVLLFGTLFFTPLVADANGEACRELLDNTERLACYDTAFGAPSGAVDQEDLTRLERLIDRNELARADSR
jgi:hypothetical protein